MTIWKHIQNMIGYIPKSDLQVVFTSLHGTSVPIVPELLKSLNFNQFNLVEAQCKPDPNFSSVQSANPEDHRAFDQAVELANKSHADLLISTDPDADRLGIAERDARSSHILMATKLVRCYLIIVFNKRLNYVTA